MKCVIGKEPNPKQKEFFQATERHIAYGGARGGGKSWAARTKCILLAGRYPGIKILLLRRTLGELKGNHENPMLVTLAGLIKQKIVKHRGTDHEFWFINGSMIKLGYCDAEKDVLQYQGQEYDVICLEEATHFTEEQRRFLMTCNRSTRTDFKPRMYYTCNPGGVGHTWVKRLFIDRQYQDNEKPEDYKFIQAKVYDNYVLMEANPTYIDDLKSLPEDMRRAHLEGDWDVFAGQYFNTFRRDINVVEPFEIPQWWRRYRAIDYGLDCAACVWAAFDDIGNAYVYREYAQANRVISDAAKDIVEMTPESEQITDTFGPRDMWGRSRESGQSQAYLFAENGVVLTQVNQRRENGWLNLQEWLKPINDGTGKRSRLRIFSNCSQLISHLTQLQHDDKHPNDVATEPHNITHLPDALRYMMDGLPQCAHAPMTMEYSGPSEAKQIETFLNYGR